MQKDNPYGSDLAKFSTISIIGRHLGRNSTILDVGCNSGYLKKTSDGSNVFYGIEILESAAREAETAGYAGVLRLDLDRLKENPFGREFDVLVLADVLEHLVFPEKVLAFLIENCLADNGRIIISLPNVAHLSVRAKLLFGKFNYTESGILDKTHLHLYTLVSAKKLFGSAGTRLEKVEFSSNRFGRLIRACPFLGNILGYNLILIGTKEKKK